MSTNDIIRTLDLDLLVGQRDEAGNPCFALGRKPELSAGLYGFVATPYFDTQDELGVYIGEHWADLEAEYIAPFLPKEDA